MVCILSSHFLRPNQRKGTTMTRHIDTVERDTKELQSTATDAEVMRYARCIEVSKRVRWDIENDVIQGRTFDMTQAFLPDGFTKMKHFGFLPAQETCFISQIQGRTYAKMFGLLERFVNAKVLEVSRDHWLGDQVKLEALVRFSDEEIKHQALFRRIEGMIASAMPAGYDFAAQPDPVARMVLSKSTWAVLGLTMMIELVTQAHYRESIAPGENLSPLYKDVFRHHWMEESQHAIMDELEWRREDAKLSARERDAAVDDIIELAVAIDQILQIQAVADAKYFATAVGRPVDRGETEAVAAGFLRAYRWQYIFSGAENPRFADVITGLVTQQQMQRIGAALAALS
jgi:hypothetical protein